MRQAPDGAPRPIQAGEEQAAWLSAHAPAWGAAGVLWYETDRVAEIFSRAPAGAGASSSSLAGGGGGGLVVAQPPDQVGHVGRALLEVALVQALPLPLSLSLDSLGVPQVSPQTVEHGQHVSHGQVTSAVGSLNLFNLFFQTSNVSTVVNMLRVVSRGRGTTGRRTSRKSSTG